MRYDVFNGDADGLCALQQLQLTDPAPSTLITDIKQTVRLVERIQPPGGSVVTVLDVSFQDNREAVLRLLAQGTRVRYFDHHIPGEIPNHPLLETHIDTNPAVCTALLVNRHLKGRQARWAAVGAFGDNMASPARNAVAHLNLTASDLAGLEELGTLLNYNGYGSALEDLHMHPLALYQALHPHEDPLEFLHEAPEAQRLRDGFAEDMARAQGQTPALEAPEGRVYLFPHSSWARRVMGVFANQLAKERPHQATAVGVTNADGTLRMSVRAPLHRPQGADALCRQFPQGGGRSGAGAVNALPPSDLEVFLSSFRNAFPAIKK
ncbi:MAG: acetyltransferase [Deltaproteobacteria bacterium]|nr:acetyltransferase [Deltaproteobacteria bacterium]